MEDLPSIFVSTAATKVSLWPDDDLRRAYRLSVLALTTAVAHAQTAPDDLAAIESAEEEALLFGNELLRRGLI